MRVFKNTLIFKLKMTIEALTLKIAAQIFVVAILMTYLLVP